jgi:hypothetical protein
MRNEDDSAGFAVDDDDETHILRTEYSHTGKIVLKTCVHVFDNHENQLFVSAISVVLERRSMLCSFFSDFFVLSANGRRRRG